jgi:hypothetical protein
VVFISNKFKGSTMNQASIKKYAMTGLTVLAVLVVFNTIAKRVPALATVKSAVDNGL